MKNINWCLALEGGGARGAYQIGALKFLYERNFEFEVVVGTSIGAINAAVIAQKDFEKAYSLWKSIEYIDLFDIDSQILSILTKEKDNFKKIRHLAKVILEIFKTKGVNTHKMRTFLQKYIDEDKIRNSDIKLGITTYCLSDFKPLNLFIDDIDKGNLIDYLLASSRLPLFKQEKLNGKVYIDGGIYNNCPVDMLQQLNKTNIIAIYTDAIGVVRKIKNKDKLNLIEIKPSKSLPNFLFFEKENCNKMLLQGYYDAMKVIDKLDGIKYYIISKEKKFYKEFLSNFNIEKSKKIYKQYNILAKYSEENFVKETFKILNRKLNLKTNNFSYINIFYSLTEYIAIKNNIEFNNLYTVEEYLKLLDIEILKSSKNQGELLLYNFIKLYMEV